MYIQVWASLIAQLVNHLPTMQETQVRFLRWEDPLEKEMAIHSSILIWEIPRTEEPGRLQSTGLQESDTTEQLTHTLRLVTLALLVAQMVKNLPAVRETQVQSLCQEDPLEKEMATHSSILIWEIPWTGELADCSPQGHKESGRT